MTYRLQNLRTHRPFIIAEGTWNVGRDESMNLVIHDASVSQYHATLVNRTDGLWVADAGSSNGTRIQHQEITDWALLQVGEVLMLGEVAFLLLNTVLGVEEDPAPIAASSSVPVQSLRTVKLPSRTIEQAKIEVKRLVDKSESQMLGLAKKHNLKPSVLYTPVSVDRITDTDRVDLVEKSQPHLAKVTLAKRPVEISAPAPSYVNPAAETDNVGQPVPRVTPRAVPMARPVAPSPEPLGTTRAIWFLLGLVAGLVAGFIIAKYV
jgi:pSer/pThr/pTyr-binding forkhead associated (FHA) protein